MRTTSCVSACRGHFDCFGCTATIECKINVTRLGSVAHNIYIYIYVYKHILAVLGPGAACTGAWGEMGEHPQRVPTEPINHKGKTQMRVVPKSQDLTYV